MLIFFYFIIIIANTKLYDWWLEIQPKAQTGAGDKSGESLQKGGVFQLGRGEVEAGGPLGSMHVEGGPPPHLQHSSGLCNVDITSSARSSPAIFHESPSGSIKSVSRWTP